MAKGCLVVPKVLRCCKSVVCCCDMCFDVKRVLSVVLPVTGVVLSVVLSVMSYTSVCRMCRRFKGLR